MTHRLTFLVHVRPTGKFFKNLPVVSVNSGDELSYTDLSGNRIKIKK